MIKRNIALVFTTNALILACSVVTSLLGAWALGPEGRGEVALITLWPHVCMYLGALGLPNALRYWTARRPDWTGALCGQSLLYALAAGGLAVLAAEFVVPRWIGARSEAVMWLVRLFLFNAPLILLFELLRGILEGARRFAWLGAARLAFYGVQGAGYLGLWATNRLTVKTAVLTLALGQLVCTALAAAAVWRELRPRLGLSRAAFAETLRYGLRSYPGTLTENSQVRLDQLMLANLAASSFIGLHAVAVALAEITSTLASSVSDALLPEVAAAERRADALNLLTRSLALTAGVQVVALIPGWLLSPYILRFLYGADFVAAADALRVLLVASAVLSLGNIVVSGLNGFGHPGLSATARLAAAVTTLAAMPLFVPRWGLVGAAAATLVSYCALLVVASFWLYRLRKAEGGLRIDAPDESGPAEARA
jgi:O-antigen/teichoic acid export membrane protein